MSKYIIDIPKTVGTGKVGSVHYTYFDGIQCQTIILKSDEIEELNSDYINEHYGDLMDEEIRQAVSEVREMKQMCGNINMKLTNIVTQRGQDIKKKLEAEYKRGLEDGKAQSELGCEGCKHEGISRALSPCHYCTRNSTDYWTAKQADDEIKVGDEVIYNNTIKCLVVRPETDERYAVLIDGNGSHHSADHRECKKTGRHFDIASILKEMQS